METPPFALSADDPAYLDYIRTLIADADRQRLPELFAGEHPGALYRLADRHGIGVVALRTPDLSADQLVKIMKYRLAQYLMTNFVDARKVYEARMEHEPLSDVSAQDIHIIAGAVATGQILCYLTVKALDGAQPGMTLRRRDRPLFPVEQVHGWGIYNRLRILPDLPISRVRELGRFVKNQLLPALSELTVRAPIEIGVAGHRLVIGALAQELDALIGDFEVDVAKKNLDFFHTPMVVIHGTMPYLDESIHQGHLQRHFVPFAWLASDMVPTRPRLAAIEAALALPGKQGLLALMRLKEDTPVPRSSLLPPGGLPPLTDADLPQRRAPLPVRREWLDLGEQLRSTDLFAGLSVGEATALGTFMQRQEVAPGAVILRQGEVGDALYLIEAGRVEVRRALPDGRAVVLAQRGPGEYVGEIALVTGGERTAEVVALEAVRLLRLGSEDYRRYLSHLVDVEQQLTRTAAIRSGHALRALETAEQHSEPQIDP